MRKYDIAAPGVSIISTVPEGEYDILVEHQLQSLMLQCSSTYKSMDNSLSTAEIKDRILGNVTKSQHLSGKVSTSGD